MIDRDRDRPTVPCPPPSREDAKADLAAKLRARRDQVSNLEELLKSLGGDPREG